MNQENNSTNLEDFFQARQAIAMDAVLSKDQRKLTALVSEQQNLTEGILTRMVPGEDNEDLLKELEMVLTLIGELSHRQIYLKGLQDGARLSQVLGNIT